MLYPRQRSLYVAPLLNTGVQAPCSNQPLIYEPTSSLLAAIGEPGPIIGIALSGGPNGIFSPTWGGANIKISLDDLTYVALGTFSGPSVQGILIASLPSFGGSNPDNTNTLSLTLAQSHGELQTVTPTEAQMGLSLLAICDPDYSNLEFVGYVTATLTGSFQYNLTTLYRGMYGTSASTHDGGSMVALISSGTFSAVLPNQYVGHALYVKFENFNVFNQGFTSLADCPAYVYTPAGVGQLTNFIITDTVSDDAIATETGDRLVWTL